jgi:hypothetical protein
VLQLLLFRCFLLGLTFEPFKELGVRHDNHRGSVPVFQKKFETRTSTDGSLILMFFNEKEPENLLFFKASRLAVLGFGHIEEEPIAEHRSNSVLGGAFESLKNHRFKSFKYFRP